MKREHRDCGKLILVCIDAVESGAVSGRFYYGDLDREYTFVNLSQFLVNMDRMLDCQGMETVTEEGDGVSVWRPGKLATFKLRILFHQKASWQGSVMWLETRHEEQFRSALELLSIFHQALVPSQEKRMRPSSLKLANAR